MEVLKYFEESLGDRAYKKVKVRRVKDNEKPKDKIRHVKVRRVK